LININDPGSGSRRDLKARREGRGRDGDTVRAARTARRMRRGKIVRREGHNKTFHVRHVENFQRAGARAFNSPLGDAETHPDIASPVHS
jgi:hypothetical protein